MNTSHWYTVGYLTMGCPHHLNAAFTLCMLTDVWFLAATLPGMWERTLTVGSAGKTFNSTGWKVRDMYVWMEWTESVEDIADAYGGGRRRALILWSERRKGRKETLVKLRVERRGRWIHRCRKGEWGSNNWKRGDVGAVVSNSDKPSYLMVPHRFYIFLLPPPQLGWSIGPAHFIKHMATVSSNSCYTIPTLLQVGLVRVASHSRLPT